MCIIAIQPVGQYISKKTLKNCWENNNDGAGIMYVENGKVTVKKELTDFNKFYQYKKYADKLNVNIVLHFRISTSAGINIENVHPFKVNNDLYFCHNGVLNISVPVNSKINDTQIYNNTILKNLPKNFQYNSSIVKLISDSIGSRNKFVFLDSAGYFTIVNESAGKWHNGCWFSNNTFEYSYYSNIIESNYYTKKKINTKKDIYFDEIDTFSELLKDEPIQRCECCYEKHNLSELNYAKYWNSYLCADCFKSYA